MIICNYRNKSEQETERTEKHRNQRTEKQRKVKKVSIMMNNFLELAEMKFDELVILAEKELKENDDLFVDMVNELDSWNGYADGFRCYSMYELDDIYCDCKASKLIEDLTEDFNIHDDYFYFSIYGLESTVDITQLYRDNVDEGELLDNILDNFSNLYFSDHEFEELIQEIDRRRNETEEQ